MSKLFVIFSLAVTVPASFLPFLLLSVALEGADKAHERFSWSIPWDRPNDTWFFAVSACVWAATSAIAWLMWKYADRFLDGEFGLSASAWRMRLVPGILVGASLGAWVAFVD
jgi:hypothetical protein